MRGNINCTKYMLIAFNVLFFVVGGAILGAGAHLHIKEGPFMTLLPSMPFLNVANVMIFAGIVILVVSFIGGYGAIKEHQCLLLTYFVFMVLVFILEVTAGGLGFVYRWQVAKYVANEMRAGGLAKYNTPGEGGLTKAWDKLQSTLACCGVFNDTDWANTANGMFLPRQTPDSCCLFAAPGCGKDVNSEKFIRGCKGAIIMELESKAHVVGIACIIVAIFQIFGIGLAYTMWKSVSDRAGGNYV
ncbi:tetraspanin-4 [Strongylocentrotus purpuratus]|uniref:Tetraspanin n=1 Tax=Strongylocentrotus purpuratus TaxID=7668 RepID=A0A7M7P2E1_STRPU|nr:tetraspanin-4 [Strongylocentrotus purpuratus]|eukprot:XP_011661894.1 PREDICTED: tetraspanin-4 [Strongylocentrotus purpuratus]